MTRIVWALTGHLGTVRDLVRFNSGVNDVEAVVHRTYAGFGYVTSESNPEAVDVLFGFTTRLFDRATGLQNNLIRWYDPAVGRWVSEDPIGFAGGDGNLTRYASNIPTGRTDASGLSDASDEEKLERIKRTADWTRTVYFGSGNACHKYVQNLRKKILRMRKDYYDNDSYEVHWAEWRFKGDAQNTEHAALRIEHNDGTVEYIDNGYLGGPDHVFTTDDVPNDWLEDRKIHGQPLEEDHNAYTTGGDFRDNVLTNLGIR